MNNLSKHRLNDFYEIEAIIAKIGAEKFDRYREAVFALLTKIRMSEIYNILEQVKVANHGVFVKCACMYILSTAGNCNVMFSDDYTKVIGIQSFNDSRKSYEDYESQVKRIRAIQKA